MDVCINEVKLGGSLKFGANIIIQTHPRKNGNQINVHYCKFKTGLIDHDVVNGMAGTELGFSDVHDPRI